VSDLPPLAELAPGQPFPPIDQAWPANSPAAGLLAVGGMLDVPTLVNAYEHAVFPWFNEGEPTLWWSPDPRMVLHTDRFRLHRSLRRTLARFRADPRCELRVDTAFEQVMLGCARVPRPGQRGTWIGQRMLEAYVQLHEAGHAHSVETWIDGRLVAGLYCVTVGRAVFGESMFTLVTDGSKMALAGLVAFCRVRGLPLIDCQQNTAHLASLGATEIPRADFARAVQALALEPAPAWRFEPVYWDALLSSAAEHR